MSGMLILSGVSARQPQAKGSPMKTELSKEIRIRRATTIKRQIGVGALMRTGARDFVCGTNGDLSFKVGSGRGRIKSIRVSLNSLDLYDVTYEERIGSGMRIGELVKSESAENVYFDSLPDAVVRLGDR